MPKVILIQGASGAGKTTLINQLLVFAAREHKKLGIIKSCGHAISIDDDTKKDSFQFRQAGAQKILLHQGQNHTLFSYEEDTPLNELVSSHFSDFDMVFVEGFSNSCDFPRIIVMRNGINPKTISDKKNIVAFASDDPCISLYADIPVLDLNAPQSIYALIQKHTFFQLLSSDRKSVV